MNIPNHYSKILKSAAPLSNNEEAYLRRRILNSSPDEREDLIQKMVFYNLRLAANYATKMDFLRYSFNGIDVMDIIQLANMGLTKAARKFDYSRNIKFSTYAYFWMRHEFQRELKKNYGVSVPFRHHDIKAKIAVLPDVKKTESVLENIVNARGVSKEATKDILTNVSFLRIDLLEGPDHSACFKKHSENPEEQIYERLDAERFRNAINKLTEEEKTALYYKHKLIKKSELNSIRAQNSSPELNRRKIGWVCKRAEKKIMGLLRKEIAAN